jgi:hypothetical protein
MMEKCFDEGTIQAFLDGELELEMVDQVSRHIALCDSCALAIAEAEEEIEFAYSALDNEFNTLVPTERLWTKINNSIETEAKNKSIWQSVFAFLTNPSTVAFASLLIVFGLFVGLYGLQNGKDLNTGNVASNPKKDEVKTVNVDVNDSNSIPSSNVTNALSKDDKIQPPTPAFVADKTEDDSEFKVRNAYYVKPERRSPRPKIENNPPDVVYVDETLAAEESYVKTISTLEKTVNNRKDEVLRPSARFAFERDMAVTDDTIKKLKEEVSKNPKNEAARVLLRNSYQNKINLLNSVAEKTDLMASLN